MVILVNMMFSNYRNINTDSNYVFLKETINRIIKKRPDWKFVLTFPVNKGWVYHNDGWFSDNKNVVRLPIKLPYGKRQNAAHFDMNFWRKVFSQYWFDLVWNQVVEQGHLFYLVGANAYEPKAILPVINQHHYVIHPSLPYPFNPMKPLAWQQVASSNLVHMNIFNSNHTLEMMKDTANILKTKITGKAKVLRFGLLDIDLLEECQQSRYEKLTFIYNHRLLAYKNWQTTFELFDRLWENHEGKFQVVVTGVNQDNINVMNKKPYTVVKKDLHKREDYLRELSKCHINVTNSQHETYCISAVESLAYGQWLIAPDGVTFPELVEPLGDDYVYLFSNPEQEYSFMETLLKAFYLGNGGFDKHAEEIKKKIRKAFNIDTYADKYIALMENITERKFFDSLKEHNVEKANEIKKHLAEGNVITLKQARSMFSRMFGGRQAFSNFKAKRILNEMGFEDVVSSQYSYRKDNQFFKYGN